MENIFNNAIFEINITYKMRDDRNNKYLYSIFIFLVYGILGYSVNSDFLLAIRKIGPEKRFQCRFFFFLVYISDDQRIAQ